MNHLAQDLILWLEKQPCPNVSILHSESLEVRVFALDYLLQVRPLGLNRQHIESALDGSTLEEFICAEMAERMEKESPSFFSPHFNYKTWWHGFFA